MYFLCLLLDVSLIIIFYFTHQWHIECVRGYFVVNALFRLLAYLLTYFNYKAETCQRVVCESALKELLKSLHSGHLLQHRTQCSISSFVFVQCGSSTPCPRKKQSTIIFDKTSPSVEIFLQFLKHLVQDQLLLDDVIYYIIITGVRPLPDVT